MNTENCSVNMLIFDDLYVNFELNKEPYFLTHKHYAFS